VLDGHVGPATCVVVSPEQCVIASGSEDASVILWDANRLKYIRQLAPHNGPIQAVDIHPYWVRKTMLVK